MKWKYKVDTEEIKSEKRNKYKVEPGESVIKDLNYSHMGAKKVPMAEKRTYPGSELT